MSIVDDLIENLVEKNAVVVSGALTVAFVTGGLSISGTIHSTVRDQKKNKALLNVEIPIDAKVGIGDVVIPLPQIR